MPAIKAAIINPAAIAAAKKEIDTFHNTGKWTNVAIRDAWLRSYADGRAQYIARLRTEPGFARAEIIRSLILSGLAGLAILCLGR